MPDGTFRSRGPCRGYGFFRRGTRRFGLRARPVAASRMTRPAAAGAQPSSEGRSPVRTPCVVPVWHGSLRPSPCNVADARVGVSNGRTLGRPLRPGVSSLCISAFEKASVALSLQFCCRNLALFQRLCFAQIRKVPTGDAVKFDDEAGARAPRNPSPPIAGRRSRGGHG